MSLNYTGNPVGTGYGPDPGPGTGRTPIIVLPDGIGDENDWKQPLATLADHIAFINTNLSPFLPAFFGDGSDGPLDIEGGPPILLNGVVKNYTDLTIGSSGILIPRRSIIRCSGTLTVNGLIHANGAPGTSGTTSAYGRGGQGTDGIGGSIAAPAPVGGGTSGGNGTLITAPATGLGSSSPTPTQGAQFLSRTNATGLVQGSDTSYVGRSAMGGQDPEWATHGFPAGGLPDDAVSPDLLGLSTYTPGFVPRTRYLSHGGDSGSFAELVSLRGGTGGSGGFGIARPLTRASGDTATYVVGTGGGGAGADPIWIFARNVVLGNSRCIQSIGGPGGNSGTVVTATPGGNGAFYTFYGMGGGGGGGGLIGLFYSSLTGASLDPSVVAGGLGGFGDSSVMLPEGPPAGAPLTRVPSGANGTLFTARIV